jgi:hypothetical protein
MGRGANSSGRAASVGAVPRSEEPDPNAVIGIGDGIKRKSFLASILGVKMVEEGVGYSIVKIPIWARGEVAEVMIARIVKDMLVMGKQLKVTKGDSLVKFEIIQEDKPASPSGRPSVSDPLIYRITH